MQVNRNQCYDSGFRLLLIDDRLKIVHRMNYKWLTATDSKIYNTWKKANTSACTHDKNLPNFANKQIAVIAHRHSRGLLGLFTRFYHRILNLFGAGITEKQEQELSSLIQEQKPSSLQDSTERVNTSTAQKKEGLSSVPKETDPIITDRLTAENFSTHAQRILEDFYKKPLPKAEEVTVCLSDGKNTLWKDLSKDEQEEFIKQNKKGATSQLFIKYGGPTSSEHTIPRWVHGCMHVSRAAMAIRLLASFYEVDENSILLAQYLTLFHDSARQAEGVDVWDDQSANNARSYLVAIGFKEKEAEEAILLLKNKSRPHNENIITKLIHDADCLDILRVYGKKHFDSNRLYVFNDLKQESDKHKELVKLIDEYSEFVSFTENPCIKHYLENQKNYYSEMVSLTHIQTKDKGDSGRLKYRFPLILKLLKQQSNVPKLSFPIKCAALFPPTESSDKLITLKELVKMKGSHPARIIGNKMGQLFFWKQDTYLKRVVEEGASRMANFITEGLVPIARELSEKETTENPLKNGTIQPFIKLKKGPFAPKNHRKVKNTTEFNPELLTQKQRDQLFCHMIADRVISNYDAHTAQFGIDELGDLIGFDKGQSYRFFANTQKTFKDTKNFDPNTTFPCLGLNRPVYPIFAKYLKDNQSELVRIWNSQSVRNTFIKCNKLNKDMISQSMKKYADLRWKGDEINEFFCKVEYRAKNIEKEVQEYFKLT